MDKEQALDYIKVWTRFEPRLKPKEREAAVTDVLLALVTTLLDMKESHMKLSDFVAKLQSNVQELTAKVTAQTTVVGSVKALLSGQAAQIAALRAQVQELIDAGGSPEHLAALQQVVDALDAQEATITQHTEELAQAAAANTTDE